MVGGSEVVVGDPGVKLVAYLLAFLAAVFSVMALMTATFGLFQYRTMLRRTRTRAQ